MNSEFEPQEGTDANLVGPEWPSTLYCTSEHFATTTTPPSPSCGPAERPLRRRRTGSRKEPGGKGQALQQPGEAAGALFQPLGWGSAGGGEVVCPRGPPRSPPRGLVHQRVPALGLCAVSSVTMETQRNAERGARGSAGSLASLSFPSRTPDLQQGLSGVVVPRRRPRAAAKMRGAARPRLPLTC